ncbi:putative ankyrin repeat protein RF_0381 [Coccinella septempunctata]|uniref:putative ankyrin repeat protein RF_0381 n=1 Tax=Coccinella septempunctata TaxID=41139 RepID=UPI001D08A507|nr:putative ankyrin repeat protein RF_0381 [Coccinella septempunctata]
MENGNTNVSPIEFVRYVRYYWSVETLANFLEHTLHHLDFHVDTLHYRRKTVLELLVGDKIRHNSREKSMMCLLLKHGASPLKRLRCGGTIIQRILRNKDSALIIEFLKYVEDIDMIHGKSTALNIAVRRQLKDVVKYIIGRNADVNKKSWTGCTPLHESIRSRSKSVDMMKILLESGADMEIKSGAGQTPLHMAVDYNNIDQVRTLIMNGANVNSTDSLGGTPLHTLCSRLCSRGIFDFELYELLLQNCNVNAKDNQGVTPLHYLMRFLPEDSSTSEKRKLINLFLKYGGDLQASYDFFGTVLHTAAFFNQSVPFLAFLIDIMADINIVDIGTVTFMHFINWKSGEAKVEEVLKFLSIRECECKFQFNDNLLRFIESGEQFIEFQMSCKNELRILKDRKLRENDSFSLFTALATNERDLAKIYRYDHSRITGITDVETENFPIYGNDLVTNHRNAIAILEAEISIYDFLTKAGDNVLDQCSIYEIVKSIPTQDIVKPSLKLN